MCSAAHKSYGNQVQSLHKVRRGERVRWKRSRGLSGKQGELSVFIVNQWHRAVRKIKTDIDVPVSLPVIHWQTVRLVVSMPEHGEKRDK